MNSRDDFTVKTKSLLARRTGYRCSSPQCNAWTCGPDLGRATNVIFYGIAAHITAAAPGGPRYDPSLTTEDRRSIENGIYLCDICAKTVDEEVSKYPVVRLKEWKIAAEKRAYDLVNSRRIPCAAEPIIVSPPLPLGRITRIRIGDEEIACARLLDDISSPWFFDDTALVSRFMVTRNREYDGHVVLSVISLEVDKFERLPTAPEIAFPMGARCVPYMYQVIMDDPIVAKANRFVAHEIGEYIQYPTPILLDDAPTIVDVRIDTKTAGLYSFNLFFEVTMGDRSGRVLVSNSTVYFSEQ